MRFEHVTHLGSGISWYAPGADQRLARTNAGGWYLYDWSGDSPEQTDDGPLRIMLDKPIEVHADSSRVAVYVERSERQAYCHVQTKHLHRLLEYLPEVELRFHGDVMPLLRLFAKAALKGVVAEREVGI